MATSRPDFPAADFPAATRGRSTPEFASLLIGASRSTGPTTGCTSAWPPA